jgi:hypothetical protein
MESVDPPTRRDIEHVFRAAGLETPAAVGGPGRAMELVTT